MIEGKATITVSGRKERVKRQYSFSDSDVTVTATLQDPAAVPDDADFVVKKVEATTEGYNYDAYMDALNENSDKIKALVAALESKKVADFITSKYNGAVVSTVDNPGDGYDKSVNYDSLKGTKITVAASPTPHAEILAIAKDILSQKGITLDVKEFSDYVQPNKVVDSGEIDANYFQHKPYLDDFNKENGTKVVSVAAIHVEPMGVYGGKQTSLDAVK